MWISAAAPLRRWHRANRTFWEKHNSNRASFREIVGAWFPENAREPQATIDWITQNGNYLSPDWVVELQAKFGATPRPLIEVKKLEGCPGISAASMRFACRGAETFGSMIPGNKVAFQELWES